MSYVNMLSKIWRACSNLKSFSREIWHRLRRYWQDLAHKLKDLKKTNFDLALYHFDHGNINDAILRFRILKQFSNDQLDLDYYLGSCYLEKHNNSKALFYLKHYLSSQAKPNFAAEADYYQSLAAHEYDRVSSVPPSIVSHLTNRMISLNQMTRGHTEPVLSETQEALCQAVKEVLTQKALQPTTVLHVGFGEGAIGLWLRRESIGHYLNGLDSAASAVKYVEQLTFNSLALYNQIFHTDIKLYSAIPAYIFIIENLLAYNRHSEWFFALANGLVTARGVLAILVPSLYEDENNITRPQYHNSCSFLGDQQAFVHSMASIIEMSERYGWHVICAKNAADFNQGRWRVLVLTRAEDYKLSINDIPEQLIS